MAIDRRDFLKFVVGGAVGTIFSPLPWMSMDEIAKWSQRWAPIPEKGRSSYIYSTCQFCPGGCGIRIRLIEQKRAVKIEGNPYHPVNRGGMCPLGLSVLQTLYYEDIRVKYPLKRIGARGSKDWKPISWEEAILQLTSKLKALRQNNLSHTVAFFDGEGEGSQAQMVSRFLKTYGTPNYVRTFQPSDLERVMTQAIHGVNTKIAYDLPSARYILSFGCALFDGWGNSSWAAQAFQEWRQNSESGRAKLVQIEPLASTTASLADEWVTIKPGREGILALGLAQVMIKKGWHCKEFVRAKTTGLADLEKILNQNYLPEQVEIETGVTKETIERLAKEFSFAKQAVALWGKGKGEIPISLFEAQAIYILNVLVGSINHPGGVYLQPEFTYASWPDLSLDRVAEKSLSQPRLDEAIPARYTTKIQTADRFFINAANKNPYPLNLLMINEANPVFSLHEMNFREAVEQIPLIVSFSSWMDETTCLADLVLPISTFLERWGDNYNCLGVPFTVYGLTKPIISPLYNTKSLGEILITLAKNLGGLVHKAFPFENMEEVLKLTAKGLYDSKQGRLTDGPLPETGRFNAASFESFDKFWEKLVAHGTWYRLEKKGEKGKGKWKFPISTFQAGPTNMAKDQKEYPLWMIPQSLLLIQTRQWPNPPFLTKYLREETLIKDILVAQVHPDTARSQNLKEGELVEVQSAKGKIKVQIHLFEGAMPNCVFVPLGLGHTAFDPTQKERGANPYPILDAMVDPLTDLKIAWATRIKILKL